MQAQSPRCACTVSLLSWLSSLILAFKRLVSCLGHFWVSLLNSCLYFYILIHSLCRPAASQALYGTRPLFSFLQCLGVCSCFRIIFFRAGPGQGADKTSTFSFLYLICIEVGVSRQQSEKVLALSLWRKLRKSFLTSWAGRYGSASCSERKEGTMTGSQVYGCRDGGGRWASQKPRTLGLFCWINKNIRKLWFQHPGPWTGWHHLQHSPGYAICSFFFFFLIWKAFLTIFDLITFRCHTEV